MLKDATKEHDERKEDTAEIDVEIIDSLLPFEKLMAVIRIKCCDVGY